MRIIIEENARAFREIIQKVQSGQLARTEAEQLLRRLREPGREPSSVSAQTVPQVNRKKDLPENPCAQSGIAVIGMSGQFPDAVDVNAFWKNLIAGHDAIRELPDVNESSGPETSRGKPYRWGGMLEERDCFDPLFFGITPREADSMNPHQRLIVQESWKALEDAGCNPRVLAGSRTGMFIGAEPAGYPGETFTGSSDAIVASRLSYLLDLKGPALVINTGCSSSAVAIHMACESLRRGETDLALAGGVSAGLDPGALSVLSQIEMLSPTGRCHTFDASADGTVLSEAVGVVVLKRLEDAVADGDPVYGVILGSGTNQDGASNGITAPSGTAQEELITEVYERCSIDPAQLTYVEAHGTGTRLGDPVEANALIRSFRSFTNRAGYCCIGSAKSFIGHTGAAAGVTGLIKVLLSLKHRMLPGQLHYQQLNPLIELDGSPFVIASGNRQWHPAGDAPLLSGVSSFGHSGTNVHLVVAEYVPNRIRAKRSSSRRKEPVLLPLSARNKRQLAEYAHSLSAILKQSGELQYKQTGEGEGETAAAISRMVAGLLSLPEPLLDPDAPLPEYGLEPIQAAKLAAQLEERYRLKLAPALLLENMSISSISLRVSEQAKGTILPGNSSELDLQALAWTLQTGREAMEERVIFLADSVPAWEEQLRRFIAGEPEIPGCWQGRVRLGKPGTPAAADAPYVPGDEGKHGVLAAWAQAWTSGAEVPWQSLLTGQTPAKVRLPAYPFSKERYGLPVKAASAAAAEPLPARMLHPMVHCNTSTLKGQQFRSVFTGDEFFLADHVVQDVRILPAVAYLEMARAAITEALGTALKTDDSLCLKNIVWMRPFTAGGKHPAELYITLKADPGGSPIRYEMISGAGGEPAPVVYSQGQAVIRRQKAPQLDLAGLRARCGPKLVKPEALYASFARMGFSLGRSFQGVEAVYALEDQVLAKLRLPVHLLPDLPAFPLHPGLMDSALQAAVGLVTGQSPGERSVRPSLPYALEELEIYGSCAPVMWALIRFQAGYGLEGRMRKLDVDMMNEAGSVTARLRGLTTRQLEGDLPSDARGAAMNEAVLHNNETLLVEPCWRRKETGSPARTGQNQPARHTVLLIDADPLMKERLQQTLPGAECLTFRPGASNAGESYAECAVFVISELKRLLQESSVGGLLQIVTFTSDIEPLYCGLDGLLRTARLEHTRFTGQLIQCPVSIEAQKLADYLIESAGEPLDQRIRYAQGERWVPGWQEPLPPGGTSGRLWRPGGVYLITGGTGGLGLLLAKEIADTASGSAIILAGRSPMSPAQREQVRLLEQSGARVQFIRADVSQRQEADALIKQIMLEFGCLHGIIHCAGLCRDSRLMEKPEQTVREVLLPKTAGLVYLDEAAASLPLDFILCFSSLSAAFGNPGQADYAAANGFMDAYAAYRTRLAAEGLRSGRTLSVNWPLWRDGGMEVNEAGLAWMTEQSGLVVMDGRAGIEALYRAWDCDGSRIMVLQGEANRIREIVLEGGRQDRVMSPAESYKVVREPGNGKTITRQVLEEALCEVGRLKGEDLDPDMEFTRYGFDSISLTELANQMNKSLRLALAPTVFFEYPTMNTVTDYISSAYPQMQVIATDREQKQSGSDTLHPPDGKSFQAVIEPEPVRTDASSSAALEPVAVIGISGQFPMARDVEEFWSNLMDGRDCIREIPPGRWDWRKYDGNPDKEINKTDIRWGGFIEGVDQFDPLFFGISPKEAELMDPQQRLLMTHVWKALEDAGCSAASLSGSSTALFVGTALSGYSSLLSQAQVPIEAYTATGMATSVGPNRMSYFLNLHGPSEPVETSCSSSLVAIHRAVSCIQEGTCEMAVAGGVNTILTPDLYISFSKAGMLSKEGRCKTFSDRADGYVRGEGAGMLVLKRLSLAERDGDPIYAVIRSTAVNHGGRSASLTAPNPKAQADLLSAAYRRAGIDPGTVTYIEAHGTGTALGDPMEINGLKAAFQTAGDTDIPPVERCGLGSVKSNIGHLELAAGVAGVIKVLLQMKHRKLVKTLHCGTVNPYIDLTGSPFYIVKENREWEALRDAEGKELPRRAGVSSFGFGGMNAHVVLEEYQPAVAASAGSETDKQSPVPIILSAKTGEQLTSRALQLLQAVEAERYTEAELPAIAYTLQTGRDAMEERLGFTASTLDELKAQLNCFVENIPSPSSLYRGHVKHSGKSGGGVRGQEQKHLPQEDLETLINQWVSGLVTDWSVLYPYGTPRRLSLPSYPFAEERYWVPQTPAAEGQVDHAGTLPVTSPVNGDELAGLQIFEEVWEAAAEPDSARAAVHGTILCFIAGEQPDGIAGEILRKDHPGARFIFVTVDREETSCNLDNLVKYAGEADTVLCLLPLAWPEDEPAMNNPAVIALLRGVLSRCKPARLILGIPYTEATWAYADAWLGFTRSVRNAQAGADAKAVLLPARETFADQLRRISTELGRSEAESVRYQAGIRQMTRLKPGSIPPPASPFQAGGTYWVTGGCGGLGFAAAGHLAGKYHANLILSGRSAMNGRIAAQCLQLEEAGGKVLYVQADVSDKDAMLRGIEEAKARYGRIDGLIHAAGTTDSRAFTDQDEAGFFGILRPKLQGTLLLRVLFSREKLKFVCCYSSSSAVLGDFGSCAYAAANRFQAALAKQWHEELAVHGGKVLSISWPLWQSEGMGEPDAEGTQLYLQASGQRLLGQTAGLRLLERLLGGASGHRLVRYGENFDLSRPGLPSSGIEPSIAGRQPAAGPGRRPEWKGWPLADCLVQELKLHVHHILKLDTARLTMDANLADFGFDSISLAEFSRRLTEGFGIPVTPALFFRHSTLGSLKTYYLTEHLDRLSEMYRESEEERLMLSEGAEAQEAAGRVHPPGRPQTEDTLEPIAIIGMSGRFPDARSIDELWAILEEGREAIREIPADRFDWREYYGNPSLTAGKTDGKWGGFIPGVREFDPAFFELSPKEAGLMDPRQRILLQEAWNALEDAGCGDGQLRHGRIGMFVGAEQGDYQRLVGGKASLTSNHNAVLASRLAYFLNFHGPVMAIDTACSSGLVAAHQAILSLRSGECDLALAAGVHLNLTPEAFVAAGQAGMLSPDGRCYAFDRRANGIVPGEAAAVVVLKRLALAEADGDPVYAVIRGSGVNYDGRTNGMTAPSVEAQALLMQEVYHRHGINPEEIGYVVAHGTGTKLGDPVEIDALHQAFRAFTGKQGFAAVTSVKSSIGHTFAASGLVGLIVLVEALRRNKIPGSLHCDHENEYISWKDSPLYVNKTTAPWHSRDGEPRVGTVSAFGMSGTNAHMVVQSYTPRRQPDRTLEAPFQLLVFSAKSEEALLRRMQDCAAILERTDGQIPGLRELSGTLLAGRLHFSHRCALVVQDTGSAVSALRAASGGQAAPNVFRGMVAANFVSRQTMREMADDLMDRAGSATTDRQVCQEALYTLAELYCQGYDADWSKLFGGILPGRVHLPAYPFAAGTYWVRAEAGASQAVQAEPLSTGPWPQSIQPGVSVAKPTGILLRPTGTVQTSDRQTEGTASSVTAGGGCLEESAELTEDKKLPAEGPKSSKPAGGHRPAQPKEAEPAAPASRERLEYLLEALAVSLAEALYLAPEEIDPDRTFLEMGLDSVIGVEWVRAVNQQYGTAIPATKVYDYPNLRAFTEWMMTLTETEGWKQEVLRSVYEGRLSAEQAKRILV